MQQINSSLPLIADKATVAFYTKFKKKNLKLATEIYYMVHETWNTKHKTKILCKECGSVQCSPAKRRTMSAQFNWGFFARVLSGFLNVNKNSS